MARALVLVLDSVGIGGAPDAARYGDAGADTIGHIAGACAAGRCDGSRGRAGPLTLPHLRRLGLGRACELATGHAPPGLATASRPTALVGTAREVSAGKDTSSGHWEIAGTTVAKPWGYFPRATPCFPPQLIAALCARADLPGILGDCHASGTDIIARLGATHMRTGKPICYTSADSVFQIAAHEATFGLDRLYDLCRVARQLVDDFNIGRVIARPFVGTADGGFKRTAHRRDFAVPPPQPTVLDIAANSGRHVISVGKIGDIFAHAGTGEELKAAGNMAMFDRALDAARQLADGGLAFVNFLDFDSDFGHRRDVTGYARALEDFDARLPELMALMQPGDLAILTADHGCDPTWPGTDHTREQVPILAFGPGIAPRDIGRRATFADIGQTVAQHLGLPPTAAGSSFV